MLIPGQIEKLSSMLGKNVAPVFTYAKVIPFLSGKGGTGKSVLSLNTAIGCALSGKRTLLVDVDFQFPNQHLLTNIYPEVTIASVVKSQGRTVIPPFIKNLDILFGEPGFQGDENNVRNLIRCLQEIESRYEVIIADCGAGYHPELLPLFEASNVLLFILTVEPTSVMDAYTMLKILRGKDIKTRVAALINKSADREQGITALQNLNKATDHFLGESFLRAGVISDSKEIVDSVISQFPALNVSGNSLNTEVEKIVEMLFNI